MQGRKGRREKEEKMPNRRKPRYSFSCRSDPYDLCVLKRYWNEVRGYRTQSVAEIVRLSLELVSEMVAREHPMCDRETDLAFLEDFAYELPVDDLSLMGAEKPGRGPARVRVEQDAPSVPEEPPTPTQPPDLNRMLEEAAKNLEEGGGGA